MYFHTESHRTIAWLAAVLEQAELNQHRVRLDVTANGELRVKVGEGCWSALLASDLDPYRDTNGHPSESTDFRFAKSHTIEHPAKRSG